MLVSTSRIPPLLSRLSDCTCRSFTSTSRDLSAFRYTALPTRALLSISGVDSVKFLQGLVTNDVGQLGKSGAVGERLLFAAMLKADGRMLYDIFLHPYTPVSNVESTLPPTKAFFIDHSESETTVLRSYLRRHILRSKVKLGKEAEADSTIYAAWRTQEVATSEEIKEGEDWLASQAAAVDRRAPGMGWRWVGENALKVPPVFELASPVEHQILRLSQAVPEGRADWPLLPLEASLDFMDGVDFRKGCYVGQELTARTHHRGVVRKRGVVLRLFKEGEAIPTSPFPAGMLQPSTVASSLPPPMSTLTPFKSSSSRPRPSGKLGSSISVSTSDGESITLAYGSVRLEHIGTGPDEGIFVVKAPVQEAGEGEVTGVVKEIEAVGVRWLAKAFVPTWVQEKIDAENLLKEEAGT